MKNTLVIIFISLALTPIVAMAQEVPRYEVFTALQGIQDPTTAVPDIFKPIEKDMRSYRVTRQQYDDQTSLAVQTVLDIGGRTPKTSSELSAIAKDLDSRSKQIARLFAYRKELVTHMNATPKGKTLWQSVVEARPEYDDALTATFDVRYNDAVLKLLAHARDAYTTLAQSTTPFTATNGALIFSTEGQSYTYFRFLAGLRTDLRVIAIAERDRYDFLLNRPNVNNMYGYEDIAKMTTAMKEKNAQIGNWARTTSTEGGAYSPLNFFLLTQRALATNPALVAAAQNMQQARTEQKWSARFAQADFDSLTAIQKAIARVRMVGATVDSYEQAKSAVTLRMNKELQEQYNIHRAVSQTSDAEFNKTYEPAVTMAYLRAILAYQTQTMVTIQPCLGLPAKKKCTVKVKDGITISVSDKTLQKKLDALQQNFLKTFQAEYDKYKNKEVPAIGV